MSNERAMLWLSVTGLLGLGFLVGQMGAVSLAAAVAIYLVYEGSRRNRATLN